MTKKLILLILALPLFLMICLFTATSGVSLAIDIPVSDIEVLGEDIVYMNMDEVDEKYLLEYAIYPTNAANKKISLSYKAIEIDGEEQPMAKLDYDEETGYLRPLAPGMVEVIVTTVNGGFTDSLVVVVETKELISIDVNLPQNAVFDEVLGMEKLELKPGATMKINNVFNPVTASNLLVIYESSDPNVATVGRNGVVQARKPGTAIITVTSRANEYITHSFAVEVPKPDSLITIYETDVRCIDDFDSIDFIINTDEDYNLSYKVVDANGNAVDASEYFGIRFRNDQLTYVFNDYFGTVTVDITITTATETETVRCKFTRIRQAEDGALSIYFDREVYDIYAQQTEIYCELIPQDESVIISAVADNGNVTVGTIVGEDSIYYIELFGKKAGVSTVTVYAKDVYTGETVAEQSITVVIKPSEMMTNPKTNGIERSHTIGQYNADGSLYNYKLEYTTGNNIIGEGFYENVTWISNHSAVSVDSEGRIVFAEDSVFEQLHAEKGSNEPPFVTFTAQFSYGGITVSSRPIVIRCVYNGYNAFSYADLVKLTKEEKIVVLQNDIVNDFGVDVTKSSNLDAEKKSDRNIVLLPESELYTLMESSYDTTWYENYNKDKPESEKKSTKIKVLIQFKNDVYGNGHKISADNVVAYGQDKQYNPQPTLESYAIFRGPLSFVELAQGASVAAQDNVSFAVYENVTLNNIVLLSREMGGMVDPTTGQEKLDLQSLHYAGTTVEVFGDNVTIEYSRIRNGRNVIRAFGYPEKENADKNIHLYIRNSVLSEARDFIMRIGSNDFVQEFYKETSTEADLNNESKRSPYLPDGDKTDKIDYSTRLNYYRLSDDEKAKYDEQFIRTYVNIHNSVLYNPGIFAIGMDAHFAGSVLANGDRFSSLAQDMKYWYNLAKTSYGAKLTLTGDVRFYCWKELDKIDSSSLIEVADSFNIANGVLTADNLRFDIPSVVRDVVYGNQRFTNVLYNAEVNNKLLGGSTWQDILNGKSQDEKTKIEQNQMVHAGIAFFGGGKNYSVLDASGYENYAFNPYEISLAQAGKSGLELAAGYESFYFYLYDGTTKGFLPEHQQALLDNENEAYSCLYKD